MRAYEVTDPDGTKRNLRVLTVMVVNRRSSVRRRYQDVTYAFQVRLAMRCEAGLHPRANMRGFGSKDIDEAIADLHYRDVCEFAVGVNTSADWISDSDGVVREAATERGAGRSAGSAAACAVSTPIRFVCGCEDGHLQDVDWRRVVHQNAPGREGCQDPLWLEDGGTTGDPRQTRIYCECGASLSLNDLFQPGRLGNCRKEWPWIDNGRDPNECGHMLRLLTRSATNTYFPQVARVISLPTSVDQLTELVRSVWSALQSCSSAEDVKLARRFNPQVAATLEGYPDDDVWSRIAVMRGSDDQEDQAENPRLAEFAILASGQAVIGTPTPDALLHAETLPRTTWDAGNSPLLRGISSLVAVHRLREVACLYGFTRFEPAPVVTEEFEDVGLAVRGAPLARNPNWLPAVEQFGEGLFLTLDRDALQSWRTRVQVQNRMTTLRVGADRWLEQRRQRGENISDRVIRDQLRPEYLLAHSLAHALITEVAIDCGYPASSIHERIYIAAGQANAAPAVGILIYTASAGNQGTLGGLVEVSRRFAQVLDSALERQRLCSGDPVCADHDPATAADDRTLHGAACHGCLVIAETSCEARNLFLDRALLVDTVGPSGVGFF
jgi:hypothetical protein